MLADEEMRRFWDDRARENAVFFVDSGRRYQDSEADVERFWGDGREQLDALLLGAHIAADDTVVDIGCGLGRLTRAAAERAGHVIGIDVSGEMIRRARELNADLPNVEFLVGDGAHLEGIADASADVCISNLVFRHIPDPQITLGYVREIGRVLRPGGWAAITVSNDPAQHRPAPPARPSGLRRLVRREQTATVSPAWLGSAVDLDDLRDAAADGGMDVERVADEGTQQCRIGLRRRGGSIPPPEAERPDHAVLPAFDENEEGPLYSPAPGTESAALPTDSYRSAGAAAIRGYLGIVRRQGWLVLVCAALTAAAAGFLTDRKPTRYSATARLLVRSYDPARALPGVVQSFGDPTRTRATDLQLITLPPVARAVARTLDLGLAPGALAGMVSTNSLGDSDIITVTATSRSQLRSVLVANGFADAYVRFRRVTNRRRFEEPIRVAQLNLERARRQHEDPVQIKALTAQVERLRLLGSLETADAQVVSHAGPDNVGVIAPKTVRAAIAGALVGLLIGLLLAFLRERLDDRLRREDDIRSVFAGIPVVGRIPILRGGRSSEGALRAFSDLRLTLDVLTPKERERSLLITSAADREGKSTTAANLALVMARDSKPGSVLLVDADLRRPELSERLGEGDAGSTDNGTGVSRILDGGTDVEGAVHDTTAKRRVRGKGLRVAAEGPVPLLAAGGAGANAPAVFNQDSATVLLAGATRQAQTVIVDGPPLGLTADMLPIAKMASGVLVVVRLHHTRARDLDQLADRLTTADVRPLGIVIVGAGRSRTAY